jgi:hypothetical protein
MACSVIEHSFIFFMRKISLPHFGQFRLNITWPGVITLLPILLPLFRIQHRPPRTRKFTYKYCIILNMPTFWADFPEHHEATFLHRNRPRMQLFFDFY